MSSSSSNILGLIQTAAKKKLLFLPHAVSQMSRPERMISTQEVRQVIQDGEIIEDYPKDPRGHSCLLVGYGKQGRSIHVVCSPKENFLTIITAYLPSKAIWADNYKKRKKS